MIEKNNTGKSAPKRNSLKNVVAIGAILLISWLTFVTPVQASLTAPPSSILYVSPYFDEPTFLDVKWSFPSKFTVGIIGEHLLKRGVEITDDPFSSQNDLVDLFPCYFLMKYPIYENPWLSQNIAMGVGPYFMHQGPGDPELDGLKITGNSTWIMEWISQINQDIYLNFSMKYTHAFHAALNEIPLRNFTTLLSLQFSW